MKILETDDLKEILKRNSGGEFGIRNQAAILGAALWGLTASELSRVTIGDVLDSRGSVRKKWTLPASRSFNQRDRELPTDHPRHIDVLEAYLDWLVEQRVNVVRSSRFRGLDPNAALLVNDQGQAFGFSKRRKEDTEPTQPTGINNLFSRLVGQTRYSGDVTYKDFRSSFIAHLARPDEGGLSIRNIMEVTGIRDYASVRRVIDMDPKRVKKEVTGIYTRL